MGIKQPGNHRRFSKPSQQVGKYHETSHQAKPATSDFTNTSSIGNDPNRTMQLKANKVCQKNIGNKGFTILEMLIVLSIISLIFTLTLPNIQTRLATIREKGCESLVDVINSNIIEYELEQGQIPSSMEDLLDAGLIKEKQLRCPNGDAIYIVEGQAVRDGE